MRLFELFGPLPNSSNRSVQQLLMDVLTPLAAQKVPFVTVQHVVDKMQEFHTGINIDRGMIMDVLDPDKVKLITKIEGDRIFLNTGDAPEREVDQEKDEQEKEHVRTNAAQQAQKEIGQQ